MEVIAVLSPFYAKVQNEGIKAAYEIGEGKRFESIEKKLGMGFDTDIGMNVEMGIEMNPTEKNWDLIRKLAYDKYVSNPIPNFFSILSNLLPSPTPISYAALIPSFCIFA